MTYASVCSGIEAATAAWRPLGWRCAFVSETEPFASEVLRHRLPGVPNLGDFTKIGADPHEGRIDLLVGGSPCQPYSNAGRNGGIADPRGALALEFAGLARRLAARWVVWENVTGVLSGDGGRDFAAILSALCGWRVRVPSGGWRNSGICTAGPGRGDYSVAWRVLDARYTRVPEFPGAVPQRRRRVVLVGRAGDWSAPASVLFEGELGGGDSAPRGPAGAFSPEVCAACDGTRGCAVPLDMTNLDGREGKPSGRCFDDPGAAAYTLTRRRPSGVCHRGLARTLTPVECERLMGLPDDYTRIPWRGQPASRCPDVRRYRALGNSMCVNVMAWVGRRIDDYEKEGRDGLV